VTPTYPDLLEEDDAMEEGKISRKRFLGLGAGLGSTLGACGAEDAPEVGEGQVIADEADLAPGSAFPFTDAETGKPGVLVHLKSGGFVAYSAVCKHRGCTVAYEDGKLACPCHGSVYDPAKGAEVVAGPAPEPLDDIPVEVRGGEVLRA
jgi:Rieske Fe-S protein